MPTQQADPTRILPDLQCALLCEDVRMEMNQNFILIGVIRNLALRQISAPIGRLLLFSRWTAGFGEFIQTAKLLAPDKTTVLGKCEVSFGLRTGDDINSVVSVFQNIQFPAVGVYYIEVAVDQVVKIRFPVPVSEIPAQNQPKPPATAPDSGGGEEKA